MGFRRLTFLLSATFALALAACGDNLKPVIDDAAVDDADVEIDAPDAMPDALMCGAEPNKNCGGTCVNTNTDSNNCGDCDNACTGGQSCTSGICCDDGQQNCGGQCVNITTDDNNCGGCAGAGGDVCTSGETCSNGTCCGGTNTACGNAGQCFDLQTNPNHCGSCTTMCSSTEICSAGHCCPTGTKRCGNACVDVNSDEANCGDCAPGNGGSGTVCTNTQTCSGGLCCPTGQINCGGTCVDPNSNQANCGGCSPANGGTGDVCIQGSETCQGGVCCTNGLLNCGGTCVDPNSSTAHCGGCSPATGGSGEVCAPGEMCLGGIDPTCCGPGQINCNGICVDPQTDSGNCGGCAGAGGTACPTTAPLCSGGQCDTSCGPGEVNCNGDCINPNNDHNQCGGCLGAGGVTCSALELCSNGTCSTTCSGTDTACAGQCVNLNSDPNHCGNCTTVCGPTDECVNGMCQLDCPVGQTFCPGDGCRDLLTDELACGSCSAPDCLGDCIAGICCPTGTTLCGGQCVNVTNDPLNCGACSPANGGTGDVCSTMNPAEVCKPDGTGGGECCVASDNVCGGVCSNPLTDNANCGGCAGAGGTACNTANGASCDSGICCPAGTQNVDGLCCPTGFLNCDDSMGNPTCYDPSSTPEHCGVCGNNCTMMGLICTAGTCNASCDPPLEDGCGVCTDQDTDPNFCGVNCDQCPTGAACVDSQPSVEGGVGAACAACPVGPAAGCNGVCTNTNADNANCGGCAGSGGVACTGNTTCTDGICCPTGSIRCGNACVDPNSDAANCGGCSPANGGSGEVCASGEVCTNGDCTCPFGQIRCGNKCVTPSIDPLNCGGCATDTPGTPAGEICGGARPYCISNGCAATCPAPLIPCGGTCINPKSDSNNCGGCPGTTCAAGFGCVDSICRAVVPLNDAPAKCVGGGPPITVPIDGTPTCSGNIAATSFNFGMCSRTQFDIPHSIFTDAFDSRVGPHRPVVNVGGVYRACTVATSLDDCGAVGRCVGAGTQENPFVCIGGGVGVNGTIGPIAKTQQPVHVGGSFWAFGEIGLDWSKTTLVKERLYNEGPFSYAGTGHLVYGRAFVDGPWSTSGNPSLTINGLLTTSVAGCPPTGANGLTAAGGCAQAPWDQTLLAPCGEDSDLLRPGGWDIPVRAIVEHFRNPANNDNQAVNLKYNALSTATAPVRLDLPCGNYYLDSLTGNQPVTIVAHGRTALYVGGAADVNVEMTFDVKPTASIDLFIGSVVRIAHPITLGSPAYPRLTRLYVGSSTGGGSGTSCTSVSQCSSGLCSACPAPSMVGTTPTFAGYGACSTTPGTCSGGANLAHSIRMSQGGFFNGLLWAGYGELFTANPIEIYGSLFAAKIGSSGDVTVHYDNGAVGSVDECPPPPVGQLCESCRDCGNQPCGPDGTCQTSCTTDNQCCPPLRCDIGGTNRCVL